MGQVPPPPPVMPSNRDDATQAWEAWVLAHRHHGAAFKSDGNLLTCVCGKQTRVRAPVATSVTLGATTVGRHKGGNMKWMLAAAVGMMVGFGGINAALKQQHVREETKEIRMLQGALAASTGKVRSYEEQIEAIQGSQRRLFDAAKQIKGGPTRRPPIINVNWQRNGTTTSYQVSEPDLLEFLAAQHGANR